MGNPFSTPECLGPEALADLLNLDLDLETQRRYERHITACSRCAAELDLVKSFLAAQPLADETRDLEWVEARLRVDAPSQGTIPSAFGSESQAPASIPDYKGGWWQGLGVLPRWAFSFAALFIIAAGALQLREMRGPALRVPEDGGGVLRSASLSLAAPLGDLPVPPVSFSWSPVPAASSYEITLREVDGTQVWQSRVVKPESAVPEDAARLLLPRKTLLWQVRALDAAGQTIAESPAERFRILP